jgi:diketogulonate reductase-like aldo/keto reductase
MTDMKMPKIGFGTWRLEEGEQTVRAVSQALKAGYRLIDTARLYGNEKSVGRAVNSGIVPREEVFVTTKLWPNDFGYDHTLAAFEESLQKLLMDYVDLYLIHWPGDNERVRHESWRAMVEINGLGTAKSIGVSNFDVEQLERLIDVSGVKPSVNQIEFHPFIYRDQAPILDFCKQHGIIVEAYSPLARASQLSNKTITDIARAHHKTPAQVLLGWAMAHGTVPIPKSSDPGRIKENFDVFDFELKQAEIKALNSLSTGKSVIAGRS